MLSLFTSIIPSLFKIGDKMIVDQDKKQEFAFKVQEMMFKQMETLVNVKTYPWVDALVKLAYASEQIVKGLFRPIFSACALCFVGYCEYKGIELSGIVEGVMVSLFPAWGASRYKEKQEKKAVDPWED